MREKPRKMSIRAKILIPAGILMTVTCIVMGISCYRSIDTGMVAMGTEQAVMAAKIAVSGIDGDVVENFKSGDKDAPEFQAFYAALRGVQQKYVIPSLSVAYIDGGQLYYATDLSDSEQKANTGDVYKIPYEKLAQTAAGDAYTQDYIQKTGNGNVISVYVPIQNKVGTIVGVLGCDYDATSIVERLEATTRQIGFMVVICDFIAFLILRFVISCILKTLQQVNQKVYDLVYNEGDLTQKLNITSGDEMELIANNVDKLLEHIRAIMLNIAGNSVQLNNSSKTVVESLSSAGVHITDVSATMEEMSAAMEETSASLNQINESIGKVYEAIGNISENANSGRESSGKIMDKAADIYEKAVEEQKEAKILAQDMASVVNEKIEKSKAVEEISLLTANIINITEQTNLLSLNASIEAARAGEAGRGFAVVADEIGKLATNSAETAAQIQRVSTEVVGAVNELAEKAEAMLTFLDETAMNGYEKLLETSASYQEDVGNMNQMMQAFADESVEVKQSIDRMKEAIAAVSIAVEESAKGVTNVTEMSVDLTASVGDIGHEANSNMSIAEQLNSEVGKFKLE